VSKIEIQGGTGNTGEEDQGVVGSFVVAGHDDEFYLGGREAKYMSQHMCSVMKRSCTAIRNTQEQWFKEAYDRKVTSSNTKAGEVDQVYTDARVTGSTVFLLRG
jgi:hypothetical protein